MRRPPCRLDHCRLPQLDFKKIIIIILLLVAEIFSLFAHEASSPCTDTCTSTSTRVHCRMRQCKGEHCIGACNACTDTCTSASTRVHCRLRQCKVSNAGASTFARTDMRYSQVRKCTGSSPSLQHCKSTRLHRLQSARHCVLICNAARNHALACSLNA